MTTTLQVSHCRCTLLNEDMESLATALHHLSTLQDLSLQYCCTLNGDALVQIASALSSLKSLTRLDVTHLDLWHCNFSAATADSLFAGVRKMAQLLCLDMSAVCVYHSVDWVSRSVWPIVAISLSGLLSLRTVLFKGCDMPELESDSMLEALQGLHQLQRVQNDLSHEAAGIVQEMRLCPLVAPGCECFVHS
jgi:hypothetical protein